MGVSSAAVIPGASRPPGQATYVRVLCHDEDSAPERWKVGARVTLRDVAHAAGVSIKTASRVLNEDVYVADGTRERVLAAIAELEYEPDVVARSLRAGRDHSVAVIIDSLNDPFFATLAQTIESELTEAGYLVLVASSHRDPAQEARAASQLQQRRVAGVIVSPVPANTEWIAEAKVPVVAVDRPLSAEIAGTIVVDDHGGARTAVQHMISRGHQRIAYIGDPPEIHPASERVRGYRDALADHAIAIDDELVRADTLTAHQAAEVVEQLLGLSDPPTAIFCASRRASLGVVPTLHSLGRTDLALVGFGDFAMADSLRPGVTVVDHPADAVGMAAAKAMRTAIEAGESSGTTVIPLRLIERGSGEMQPLAPVLPSSS